MKVLIDYSSLAWASLFAGKDPDLLTNSDGETSNTAQWAENNLTNSLLATFERFEITPRDCIFVRDGINGSKFRKNIDSSYKANRSKSELALQEYNTLEQKFFPKMRELGSFVVYQDLVEADDTIAKLCETFKAEPVIIITYDKDLLVLAEQENVNVVIKQEVNPKPFGNIPFGLIDVYKALVGDPSDNISGVAGFGKKAFEGLYEAFGEYGLKELRKYISEGSLAGGLSDENLAAFPKLKLIKDNADAAKRSLALATLYPNLADNLVWEIGMCRSGADKGRFTSFAQTEGTVEKHNFENAVEHLNSCLSSSSFLALDLETTTTEDSDDWLEGCRAKNGAKGVDVLGSEIVGLGLTYGNNNQHTLYFSFNHKGADNLEHEHLVQLMGLIKDKLIVVHNSVFELTVLHNTLGYFLPNVHDTKLMASYVDENSSLGLKANSARWLSYKQQSYEETTTIDGVQRKMDELTLHEVARYGSDDTICTAALYNWFKIFMTLEGTLETYLEVDVASAYWVAQAYLDGVKLDLVKLTEFRERDAAKTQKEMLELVTYLQGEGVENTAFEPCTEETMLTAKYLKYAFEIVHKFKLNTRFSKIEKVLEAIEEQCTNDTFWTLVKDLNNDERNVEVFNAFVGGYFDATTVFNPSSPAQLANLMYIIMGLPVRMRNAPTDNMRAAGKEGTPKTDELAIRSALYYDVTNKDSKEFKVLNNLLEIKNLNTRAGLYYTPYPNFVHWKTGRIHTSLHQNAAATRRFTSSKPNLQQLSGGGKGDFREVLVPHKKNALIVSLDFSGQELRIIADSSQDENMLSCYVGDSLKDLHSLTASSIVKMDYNEFEEQLHNAESARHSYANKWRKVGKTVNFASEYGTTAKTLGLMLMIPEDEAQTYLDARLQAFPKVQKWKDSVVRQAYNDGYVTTLLGGRRHLDGLKSEDKWERLKAERQAVNSVVQGSAAEMTKVAMGRIWTSGIRNRYDIRFIAPIHDELVFSVTKNDLPAAVAEIHKAMVTKYATMEVPIRSSISIGVNLGDLKDFDENLEPTVENLETFLADNFW